MTASTKKMVSFLDNAHSVYHAVDLLVRDLEKEGYIRLPEGECWDLIPGGKYYLTRGGSALMAFRIPEGEVRGFMISASHSDRPTFKLKENGELKGNYTR